MSTEAAQNFARYKSNKLLRLWLEAAIYLGLFLPTVNPFKSFCATPALSHKQRARLCLITIQMWRWDRSFLLLTSDVTLAIATASECPCARHVKPLFLLILCHQEANEITVWSALSTRGRKAPCKWQPADRLPFNSNTPDSLGYQELHQESTEKHNVNLSIQIKAHTYNIRLKQRL